MPNWCCQNAVLRGPKEDIQRFCDTINSCLNRPDVVPNGFGKFWLGNVCAAFGYDFHALNAAGAHLRGNFDPDEGQCACLFHQDPEPVGVKPVETDDRTACVRFSLTTAWGPSDWFNDMIAEKFPSCEYGWKATDEFGNFHYVFNREVIGVPMYEIEHFGYTSKAGTDDESSFEEGHEAEAADLLNEILGLKEDKITPEDVRTGSCRLCEKLNEWNENDKEPYLCVRIWRE